MSNIISQDVQTPQHEEAANHALPPPDKQVGREMPSNYYLQMIGKLGEDEKADWPGHLAEIVYAYNTTQSTMMGYIPHYLMFQCTGQGYQLTFTSSP